MTLFYFFVPNTCKYFCVLVIKSIVLKNNGILEYLNLYRCHFPPQELPIFLRIIQFVTNPNWLLHSECLSWMLLESGTAKPSYCFSLCLLLLLSSGLSICGCVLWWHQGRRRSLAAGRGCDDAAPFVKLPPLSAVRALHQHPFLKKQKVMFCLPQAAGSWLF